LCSEIFFSFGVGVLCVRDVPPGTGCYICAVKLEYISLQTISWENEILGRIEIAVHLICPGLMLSEMRVHSFAALLMGLGSARWFGFSCCI
jgi:hypothetical protein